MITDTFILWKISPKPSNQRPEINHRHGIWPTQIIQFNEFRNYRQLVWISKAG